MVFPSEFSIHENLVVSLKLDVFSRSVFIFLGELGVILRGVVLFPFWKGLRGVFNSWFITKFDNKKI